jgi:hypothetical protein
MMTDRITANHLKRAAIVYVRQSSPEQVRNHGESTRIQVGLRDKAVAFGWRDPVTILERVVDINALSALAPLPRAPVPRPSRPQPHTPPPLEPQAQKSRPRASTCPSSVRLAPSL